jgi:hypothetical protein
VVHLKEGHRERGHREQKGMGSPIGAGTVSGAPRKKVTGSGVTGSVTMTVTKIL